MVMLNGTRQDLLFKVLLKKNSIDYKEIFLIVSRKDSLRIIIALVDILT
jgi:hypothetical protein